MKKAQFICKNRITKKKRAVGIFKPAARFVSYKRQGEEDHEDAAYTTQPAMCANSVERLSAVLCQNFAIFYFVHI